MKKARSSRGWTSSAVVIGALALITFVLAAGVLAAAQKKAPVVVAARALEAGTKLSLADVEVVQVHAGAVLEGAFEMPEDVVGLVITVQRLPGDQLTADMVGDAAQNALAQALDPDHRAVAVHVEIYQLQPGAMRPLRWNPLQFGKRIDPEQQLRAICDLWANAGGMGPRQLGFMRRALVDLYLEHGALTADRQVLGDTTWNTVRNQREEDAIARQLQELNLPVRSLCSTHLSALTAVERQALAVYRSRRVDIPGWHDRLDEMYRKMDARATTDRTSLEGVLLRLEPFSRGEMALMYGRGDDVMTIEDVSLPWGMTVFEGGAELDEYSKVALLSMMAPQSLRRHLYTDAVRRRREELNRGGFTNWMQIFFEEANKVLGGVSSASGDDDGSANTAGQFQDMWRDGRKCGCNHPTHLAAPDDPIPGRPAAGDRRLVQQCLRGPAQEPQGPRPDDGPPGVEREGLCRRALQAFLIADGSGAQRGQAGLLDRPARRAAGADRAADGAGQRADRCGYLPAFLDAGKVTPGLDSI